MLGKITLRHFKAAAQILNIDSRRIYYARTIFITLFVGNCIFQTLFNFVKSISYDLMLLFQNVRFQ